MTQFKEYFRKEKNEIIREVLITILLSALVTTLLNFYFDSIRERKDQRNTAKKEFIYNFHRTFFDNLKYRDVSTAIEEQFLYNRGKILKTNGGPFTEYQLDDYLGLIYDIWTYTSYEGFVATDIIDYQFTYYICITQQNKEILGYRDRLLQMGFTKEQAYSFLDDMAETLNFKNKDCRKI